MRREVRGQRRRGRRVCQPGGLFGLNPGRGPAAARVGMTAICGSETRSVCKRRQRHCGSPSRNRNARLHGPRQGRDPCSDRTGLRPDTRRAAGALSPIHLDSWALRARPIASALALSTLASPLSPLTSSILALTSYLLPLTSYLLPLTSYLLPLTSYLLPAN
jgi:hypothetical protein